MVNSTYRSKWSCEDVGKYLSMLRFQLPAPVFGSFKEGNYDTFLQRMEKKGGGQKYADEGQSIVIAKIFGKCDR